jgi:hypothetical protein
MQEEFELGGDYSRIFSCPYLVPSRLPAYAAGPSMSSLENIFEEIFGLF